MCRSATKFDGSSMLVCPTCNENIHVGFGGEKNLAIHHTSLACLKKSQKGLPKMSSKPTQNLHAFFKPHAPLNPPRVTAPPPVHADLHVHDKADEDCNELSPKPLGEISREATSPSKEPSDGLEMGIEGTDMLAGMMGTCKQIGAPRPLLLSLKAAKCPCPRGIELLNRLEDAAKQIPADVPLATPAHLLSSFSADPCVSVTNSESNEDGWEGDWAFLNAMLKASFGWGETEMLENVKSMLNRGEHRLDGFIQFFRYFVLERGLEGVMIETKVDALLHELDNR